MAYPGATLYQLGTDGLAPIAYTDTEHYRVTRDFLAAPTMFLRHLFADDESPPSGRGRGG